MIGPIQNVIQEWYLPKQSLYYGIIDKLLISSLKNGRQIRENLAVSTQYWTNGQNDSNQWLAFNKEVRGNVPNSQEAKAKVPGVRQR